MSPVSKRSRATNLLLAYLLFLAVGSVFAVKAVSVSHDVGRTACEFIAGFAAGYVAVVALFVELNHHASARRSNDECATEPRPSSSFAAKGGRWARILAPAVGIAIAGPLAGTAILMGGLVGGCFGMLGFAAWEIGRQARLSEV
jgi:hypothetical protein